MFCSETTAMHQPAFKTHISQSLPSLDCLIPSELPSVTQKVSTVFAFSSWS